MDRAQIFQMINEARTAQEIKWGGDRTQYKRSAPHILVLQGQMKKLEQEWYDSKSDALLNRFVQIAAIAVRALEEIDPTS